MSLDSYWQRGNKNPSVTPSRLLGRFENYNQIYAAMSEDSIHTELKDPKLLIISQTRKHEEKKKTNSIITL